MSNESLCSQLNPARLWHHFSRLTEIPRSSGNEEAVRQYIFQWATQLGFECHIDGIGNLVVWVPASPDHGHHSITVLQSHLDMVCERDPGSLYDAEQGRIHIVRDGDWLKADGTTLGADNGIGVAAMMAAAEDTSFNRGPLDLLFTIDEEVGLTGAANFDPSLIRGRRLINLDTEESGMICIGCAGGVDSRMLWNVGRELTPAQWTGLRISLTGCVGGHSGMEIHHNRGNAIRLNARLLAAIQATTPMMLQTISGGNKRNAIPRECETVIWIPDGNVDNVRKQIMTTASQLKSEYLKTDPDILCEIFPVPVSKGISAYLPEDSTTLVSFLQALPTGVISMSSEIPGLVQTSTNLAVVRMISDDIEVVSSSRSSIPEELIAVVESIAKITSRANVNCNLEHAYPGWRPNLHSNVLGTVKQAFDEIRQESPNVSCVHCGLECGLIGERIGGMDMVSIGPDIQGVHAPGERVHIESVKDFWKILTRTLSLCCDS